MIRPATLDDIDKIWELRIETTHLLKERGIDQWQYVDPSIETFKHDISNHEFFVDERFEEIVGMIAIKKGIEPTYNTIYDGKWNYELPYLTIHRLAVKKAYLGQEIAYELMRFAEHYALNDGISYIRIDTHESNKYAIKLFSTCGYQLCGYIYLNQKYGDKKRLAYDKYLGEK